MKHEFLRTEEGRWLTGDDQVYCHWRYEEDSRRLRVEVESQTEVFEVPEMRGDVTGILVDLPETAKDVAAMVLRRHRSQAATERT